MLALAAGGSRTFDTGPDEMLVLPLSGGCRVTCDGDAAELAGRALVLRGPTDFAYLPIGSAVTVSSADGGRFALPAARASRRLPFRVQPAAEVAGRAARRRVVLPAGQQLLHARRRSRPTG